jgi:PAS domain S-box-containing protein
MIDDNRPAAEILEHFRIISELVADYAFSCAVTSEGALLIEWATDSFARVTGYTTDEINQRGWQTLIHPDDLPLLQPQLDQLRAGEASVSERRIIRKGGEVRWMRNYWRPVLDEQRRLIRIHGAAQDVTEHRQADAELAKSEERFKLAVSGAPLTLFEQDLDLKYHWVYPNRIEFPEDNLGRSDADLIPAEDADVLMRLKREVIERGVPLRQEIRVTLPGTARWYDLVIEPKRDSDGNIVGVAGAAFDITDRKQAEARLQESEERFAKAFNANPDPMTIHRISDGRYIAANESFLTVTGFSRDEVLGRTAAELNLVVADEHSEHWGQLLRAQGGFHNLEAVYRTRLGEIRTALMSAEVIEVGGEPCILAVSTDITERKHAEEERAELFAREQALRIEAEQANRLKDEFLATISHELRTPLNAILGWTSMLRGGRLNDELAARALETIERNGKSQAKLIEDLLDISRIITGKLRLNVQPVELASVVEAALDVIRPAADAKEIHLEVILDPHAGPVSGDPERLQQVVWNLLSNAIKFTPKDGRVQVRLERQNSQVTLTVSDDGKGINAEFLPFVFDRFRQADAGITRVHGGLGLGLAIVRHLIEQHGGSVAAYSDGEGQGATFKFNLPLMIIHSARSTTERRAAMLEPPPRPPLECPPPLTGLRLLVVEDDPDARILLQIMLRQCEAEVKAADSVARALTILAEWQPDLLISDIEIPREDGYSLIRSIRSRGRAHGPRLPAIALTAHARAEDRVRALTAGFDAHVAKPVEANELVTVILSLARMSGKG